MEKMKTHAGHMRGTIALFAVSTLALAGCSATVPQDNAASGASSSSSTAQADEGAEYQHQPSTHPASTQPPAGDEMRVTLLGTGSPVPSDKRYGMSTLVQAGGLNLVFDAGRGATTRLNQAGISPGQVDGAFITHFHSDHVNGLSDMWLTGYIPAFGGRKGAFDIYGPTGVKDLAAGMRQAHADDIDVRVADTEVDRDTTKITAHEFSKRGVIFDQDGVTVTMFDVQHDPAKAIEPAVGFRVDHAGHSVLISGDTIPNKNVIKYGKGVDLLIHEVAAFKDPTAMPQVAAHHTSPQQAGKIFDATAPRMAAYSHIVNGTSEKAPGISGEELVKRTREHYDGPLTVGDDLMSFLISDQKVDVYKP